MDQADRASGRSRRLDRADWTALDLILACERAASRRNPRDRDPARWNKSAWRRYLYAAAHAPRLSEFARLHER